MALGRQLRVIGLLMGIAAIMTTGCTASHRDDKPHSTATATANILGCARVKLLPAGSRLPAHTRAEVRAAMRAEGVASPKSGRLVFGVEHALATKPTLPADPLVWILDRTEPVSAMRFPQNAVRGKGPSPQPSPGSVVRILTVVDDASLVVIANVGC
jgi:hypothetical protein